MGFTNSLSSIFFNNYLLSQSQVLLIHLHLTALVANWCIVGAYPLSVHGLKFLLSPLSFPARCFQCLREPFPTWLTHMLASCSPTCAICQIRELSAAATDSFVLRANPPTALWDPNWSISKAWAASATSWFISRPSNDHLEFPRVYKHHAWREFGAFAMWPFYSCAIQVKHDLKSTRLKCQFAPLSTV